MVTSTIEVPTQAQVLSWGVIYTCIGALFYGAIVSVLAPSEKSTLLYVLPRAWVFRTLVLLGFRSYLGFWNSYMKRIDAGQLFVFFVVLPFVVLGLPVLPLKDVPATANGFLVSGGLLDSHQFASMLRQFLGVQFVLVTIGCLRCTPG